jgi:hypothetical protein
MKTSGMPRLPVWMLFAVCLLSGCRDKGTTTWFKEVRSPDGRWLATATTKQWSGPGAAYVATSVYLKRSEGPPNDIEVLAFSHEDAPHMYLKMDWVTPEHLDVTYGNHATLDFQAIKCAGINITARDISDNIPNTPQ